MSALQIYIQPDRSVWARLHPTELSKFAGQIRLQPAALPGSPAAGDIAVDSAGANTLKYHNGTTWVSVASSSAVSGTTGYIPQFATSSTLGNSPLFINGSNVGIGTTSASDALSVAGTVSATGAVSAGTSIAAAGNITSGGSISAVNNISSTNVYASERWVSEQPLPLALWMLLANSFATRSPPRSPGAGDIAVDSAASNTLKYYNGVDGLASRLQAPFQVQPVT